MGYSVQSWDIDFHIPADKVEAALAAVNADPALQRPCWHRGCGFIPLTEAGVRHRKPKEHDCQRLKPFDSLTEAVEELTGFHDCQEDDTDGFRLGWHLPDKWRSPTEDLLHLLGRHADEGSYVRLMGEDNELFGYRVVDGELRDENATITWDVSPVWARMKAQQ